MDSPSLLHLTAPSGRTSALLLCTKCSVRRLHPCLRDCRKRNNQAFYCSAWRTLDGPRISSTSSLFLWDSHEQPTILPKMPCRIFDAQLHGKAKSSIEHDSSVLDHFLCGRGDVCA